MSDDTHQCWDRDRVQGHSRLQTNPGRGLFAADMTRKNTRYLACRLLIWVNN
jgi:hypothetical protein